jgi:hypothetical protein
MVAVRTPLSGRFLELAVALAGVLVDFRKVFQRDRGYFKRGECKRGEFFAGLARCMAGLMLPFFLRACRARSQMNNDRLI